MRPPILILLALGITGCAAERANSMAFELAATSRALEHELATNQAWASEVTTYVDDEGGDLVITLPSEPMPPAEASTEVVERPMEPETLDIPEEPAAPVVVVQPPPQSPPAPVDPWSAWSDPTVTSGAALGGSNTLALLNLTRAIDEHRQTLVMEARLEDKQRLIDQLRADVDEVSVAPSRSGAAQAQQAASQAQREAAAARAELTRVGEALAQNEEARAELEARHLEAQAALEEERALAVEVEASLAELATRAEEQELALANAEQERELAVVRARDEEKQAQLVLKAELDVRNEQLAGTEDAFRELLGRYEALTDQREREEEADAQRRQRRQDRWERWTWRKSRKDGNRGATREDRRLREQTALEASRVEAERAAAEAAQVSLLESAAEAEAQAHQAEIERQRQVELAELGAAELAELEVAHANMAEERVALLAMQQELEAGRLELVEALVASKQRQHQLEEHLSALQRAEDEAGFMDEGRQAEIRALEHEIETLAFQEKELGRVQAELAATRSREAALLENEAELESLRARAMEAEGMEAELAMLEAEKAERDERWSATLGPIEDFGLAVERRGDVAQVQLPSDVLFASGSAALSAEGRAKVGRVGEQLAAHPELYVAVEGHTDSQGASRANWDLAFARARATLATLEAAGVTPSRISAASYGEHRPVASNDTVEGRAANRRIELVLTIVEE